MAKCKEIQQKFYENLGDREYDCFQESESKYLKLKIGYTLYGIPEDNEKYNNLNGDYTITQIYDVKQNKIINDIYSVIKSNSIYNEDREQVVVAFTFNFCELIENKIFKKKNNNEGPKIGCFPIFRVRKCFGSPTNKNCCVYIDENARVYKNWGDYLENNKIPKAKMFLPKDGRYQGNENDEVQLDEQLSPACGLKENITKVADVSTTAVSVVSGGVAVAALIPAVTLAPVVLTGALISGAGVGIYSMIRSSLVLHDRNVHSQSISVKNNEARNCYLNILTGATGVITSGATKAASMAVNKGATIGETAATALMSVNVLNISVNGCNVANSIYSIADGLINKKNPSTLDIMHLTTTLLFFGNSVINFQTATTIYRETQNRSFADVVTNRSQSLWTRAKNKFFKTDMTSTDNNSSVNFISDTGDYWSNFINFSTRDKRGDLCKNIAVDILKTFISRIDLDSLIQFGYNIIENKDNVYSLCKLILSRFELSIQEMLLEIFKYFFDNVIQSAIIPLKEIFAKNEKLVVLLNFLINFIKFKVSEMEIDYQRKKSNTMRELNISEKEYDEKFGLKNNAERMTKFFRDVVLKMISARYKPEEILFREMIKYFWDWLSEKALEYTLKKSLDQSNPEGPEYRKTVDCSVCGGFYYVD